MYFVIAYSCVMWIVAEWCGVSNQFFFASEDAALCGAFDWNEY